MIKDIKMNADQQAKMAKVSYFANFLNPEMVRQFGNLGRYGGYVTVTCYNRSRLLHEPRTLCPNPDNFEICQKVENQYGRGIYVSKQDFTLTKEQFDDPNFWNSMGSMTKIFEPNE